MAERRYSDAEAAKIIQQASEMSREPQGDPGLSLNELKRVAEELGLDPEKVAVAAERVHRDTVLDGGQSAVLGAPPRYELDRLIEGEITQEGWEAAVAEVERVYGSGRAKGKGATRNWRRKMEFGWVNLTAQSENGRTRVRFVSYIDDGIGCAMVGTIVASVLAIAALLDALKPALWGVIVIVLGVAFATAFAFRACAAAWLRTDKAKSENILDAVTSLLRSKSETVRERLGEEGFEHSVDTETTIQH